MQIGEAGGELGWIERVRTTHAGAAGNGLAVPIGDDAAVLDIPPGRQVVVTTDMLVEGVHFRRDWSDPYSIGWKAAAVNLSDIAAMGADPTFAFVSLAFVREETMETLERLYNGFADCLTRYGARLAGGDTNASPYGLTLNVTQMGTVATGQAWTRTGARVGDSILVTGTLGNANGGLALLLQDGLARAEKAFPQLVGTHRRPQPRVVAARALAALGKVRAAMDISDGLAGDLAKLCAASGVGARVDAALVPLSEDLKAAADALGQEATQMALIGGEDLELLLIVSPADADSVRSAVEDTGIACTAVGEIVKSGLRFVDADGEDAMPPGRHGWDHFTQ